MTNLVAGLIWLLLGAGILVVAALFILEGILYLTGQALITYYVRNWGYGHVFVFAIIGAVLLVGVGMAVTHFILDGPSSYN